MARAVGSSATDQSEPEMALIEVVPMEKPATVSGLVPMLPT
jgi:hypothetical protein